MVFHLPVGILREKPLVQGYIDLIVIFSVVFSVIGLMERVSGQIIVSCVKKRRKEKTENKGNGLKIK